jgi:hypothetical protein
VPAATRIVIDPILAAHGVNADNTTMLPLASPAAAKALKDGEADVFVLIIELNAPLVQALLRDPTVRLMSVTQAEAITRVYPFLTRLVLPQGVIDFERNIPANDVSLIADTQAVLVQKTLHPELIYLLAQALSQEHSGAGVFQRAGDFPTATDPEFPVAQNAVDFYKNGPSFLDRYLPFWITNYAKRIIALLATVIVIVLPLFSYAPNYTGGSWNIVWAPCTGVSGLSKRACKNVPPPRRCRRSKPNWRMSIGRSICSAFRCSIHTCFFR